jgi:serine/threonine protein kinase
VSFLRVLFSTPERQHQYKSYFYLSIREICTLKELQHPNIVKLIDVILDTTKVYLVFEYLYMDLKKYIDDQKAEGTRIDMGLTTSYAYQICQVICSSIKLRLNFKRRWTSVTPAESFIVI